MFLEVPILNSACISCFYRAAPASRFSTHYSSVTYFSSLPFCFTFHESVRTTHCALNLFTNNASVLLFRKTKFHHCVLITLTFTSRSNETVRASSGYHLVYFYREMPSGHTCIEPVLIGEHRTTTAPCSQWHVCVVGSFQLADFTEKVKAHSRKGSEVYDQNSITNSRAR